MNWKTWSDFIAMGGYGLYVWGSVGVVFAFLLGELGELAWRRRAAIDAVLDAVTEQRSPI